MWVYKNNTPRPNQLGHPSQEGTNIPSHGGVSKLCFDGVGKFITMKKSLKYFTLIVAILLLFTACKKEYIFGVDDVDVVQNSASKNNVKTTTEFVSIAYSDVFGTTIPQNYLTKLSLAYLSFGDKKLVEDIIIKNMLNAPGVQLPSQQTMLADIDLFVTNTYKKFYNREPGEYELWKMKQLIEADQTITPELIYYAFLTSDEYRYY